MTSKVTVSVQAIMAPPRATRLQPCKVTLSVRKDLADVWRDQATTLARPKVTVSVQTGTAACGPCCHPVGRSSPAARHPKDRFCTESVTLE